MGQNGIITDMEIRRKRDEIVQVAHGESDPVAFCRKAGIGSVRNLEIYLRKSGIYDGSAWSHADIAAEYGISRPRSVQICARTENLLRAYTAGR